MTSLETTLQAIVGRERVHANAPLAPLTTFKVGGPADWLVETRASDEVRAVLLVANDAGVPVIVLGGGSNLLIADAGIRGIVIRVRGGEVRPAGENVVRADAGVTINGLVRWTISHALSGVELWAGTPGTVGGAIYGNAHFRGQNIGDLVSRTGVVTLEGTPLELDTSEMAIANDASRLQRTREILLWAEFRVRPGDPASLREIARESLAYRKRSQPLNLPSAGCIFQNPDPSVDRLPPGVPSSAGALVDRAGLKGFAIGAARVSSTHANFIVNDGGSTAAEIRALVDLCKLKVRERFGIELKEEIVCLGEF
ncbi:MAG: UDP-N-acetylmuramate dehydrogenase [Acidobacteriota bacterium]